MKSRSRPGDETQSHRLRGFRYVLLTAAALASVHCGALASHRAHVVDEAERRVRQAGALGVDVAGRSALVLCSSQARSAVASALTGVDPNGASFMREAFAWAVAQGRVALAEALLVEWQPEPDDAGATLALGRLRLLEGRLLDARELAWRGAERFTNERLEFVRLAYDAWVAEPGYHAAEPAMLEAGVDVTDIRPLLGGTSVLFRLMHGTETVGAFKPLQGRRWSYYRGELAAYRLCPLIRCGFEVPRNREVRLREADFERLYRGNLAELHGLDDWYGLRWIEDGGERWLHGTLEDWVPEFVDFPIEYDDIWTDWLRLRTPLERLAAIPLAEALRPLEMRPRGRYLDILAQAESLTTPELARLISNLHVFDFLVGNWDRYSELTYGNNNQFAHGTFVSLDLGAAFGTPEHGRVSAHPWIRVTRIERFSRSMIDAVRWLDTEALLPILFPPNPHHPEDLERYELFLERRQALLDYVDGLVATFGEEAVLAFE